MSLLISVVTNPYNRTIKVRDMTCNHRSAFIGDMDKTGMSRYEQRGDVDRLAVSSYDLPATIAWVSQQDWRLSYTASGPWLTLTGLLLCSQAAVVGTRQVINILAVRKKNKIATVVRPQKCSNSLIRPCTYYIELVYRRITKSSNFVAKFPTPGAQRHIKQSWT